MNYPRNIIFLLLGVVLVMLLFCSTFTAYIMSIWINGLWLALGVALLVSTLPLFLLGREQWRKGVMPFSTLFLGLSLILVPVETSSVRIQHVLKQFITSLSQGGSQNGVFSDFGVGLISLILTLVTGIVLWETNKAR